MILYNIYNKVKAKNKIIILLKFKINKNKFKIHKLILQIFLLNKVKQQQIIKKDLL